MAKAGHQEHGLVLLAALVFILLTTLAASSLVIAYDTQRRREKEQELLFAGAQYRKAIASYYNTIPPGGTRTLPRSFDDLLNDNRFAMPVQHLRRMYPDPTTGRADWAPVFAAGGIVGVRSRSDLQPIRTAGFKAPFQHFAHARSYSDWVFAISFP